MGQFCDINNNLNKTKTFPSHTKLELNPPLADSTSQAPAFFFFIHELHTVSPNNDAYDWSFVEIVVVVIRWFYSCPSRLFHWHWVNNIVTTVPVKQPWRMWVNTLLKSIWTDGIHISTKPKKSVCIFNGTNCMCLLSHDTWACLWLYEKICTNNCIWCIW